MHSSSQCRRIAERCSLRWDATAQSHQAHLHARGRMATAMQNSVLLRKIECIHIHRGVVGRMLKAKEAVLPFGSSDTSITYKGYVKLHVLCLCSYYNPYLGYYIDVTRFTLAIDHSALCISLCHSV